MSWSLRFVFVDANQYSGQNRVVRFRTLYLWKVFELIAFSVWKNDE
jgi:hypothetical protein